MPARIAVGVVTSDKAAKTRRVEIDRTVKHPRYGKYVKQRTICHVHDEDNQSVMGDRVEIQESRPLSRLKRWTLLRVVEKSREVDLAALRAAHRAQANEQSETLDELAGSQDQSAESSENQSSDGES